MGRRIRIFISSPGDVADERLRAALIIDKLSQDYSRSFALESFRWEHEPMLASGHFQDAIEPPSAFDIVIFIVWSRLGTPLPQHSAKREYRGSDGRAPVTGTEWEYEEALAGARAKGAPDILAFRNASPAPIDPCDTDAQSKSIAQLSALNSFWVKHFVDRGIFLAAYTEYRSLDEFAQRLEQSLRNLLDRRIKGGEPRLEAVWLRDPFRGLESYDFEHEAIFFGRDGAIMKATEQLAANARSGSAFLLVSGASGSGKSSLVKAGVVPRLFRPQRISGAAFLRRVTFRPGNDGTDVFLGLARALTRADGQGVGLPELLATGQGAPHLATHLRNAAAEPTFPFMTALGRLTEEGRQTGRLLAFEKAKLILVVDQLEELFSAAGIHPDDRRLFIKLMAGLARSGTVWVIATLRADFWHRAAEIPELIALAEGQHRMDLAAPSLAELAEMVRRPAEAAGLSFETHSQNGLALDAVLAEHAAAAPGALPLLSFTLDELYRKASTQGETVLTHADYESLGGLEGAIANRADEIMARLPSAAQAALPGVLRTLTAVSDAADQMPVARTVSIETFAEGSPARVLVEAFTAARLLVASETAGTPTIRLAHEALISQWQRARSQLVMDRRDLETRSLVERQFRRWSQPGHGRRSLLLRNPDLANAIELAKRWGEELELPLRQYIARSSVRARLAQTLTAVAAALFAVVAGAAIYAQQQAVRERHHAEQTLAAATHTANGLVFDLAERFQNVVGVPAALIKDILDRARSLQDQLLKSGQTTPELKHSEASALLELAEVELDLGDAQRALRDAEKAKSIFDGLIGEVSFEGKEERPSECETIHLAGISKNDCIASVRDARVSVVQWGRATSYEQVSQVLSVAGDGSAGLAASRTALGILETLAAAGPSNTKLQLAFADAYDRVGDALKTAGSWDERLRSYRSAMAVREMVSAKHPTDAGVRSGLRESYRNIGNVLLFAQGQRDEALASFRKALAIAQGLATEFPNDREKQSSLFESQSEIGDALLQSDQDPEAIDWYRAALATIDRLAAADRRNLGLQRLLMGSYNRLATALFENGQSDEAKPFYQKGFEIARDLVASDPTNMLWETDLAVSYSERGRVAIEEVNYDNAIGDFKEAVAIYEKLVSASTTVTEWQQDLATAYEMLGYAQVASGDQAQGVAHLRKSLEMLERLASLGAGNGAVQGQLGVVLVQLGLLGDQARLSRGLSILRQSKAQGKADEKQIYWIDRAESAMILTNK